MPKHTIQVECQTPRSFRVEKVAGMFDVPLAEKVGHTFEVELPDLADDWQIGCIVGPSGSGKSTVAREVYGASLYEGGRWPTKQAVVDGFDKSADMRVISHVLTSVGFSSPPDWVKPYGVLSNGQQFRCDLARALLTDEPLIVFDEFTSVVDRTVAKIGSAAVSKAVRKSDRKFIAVSCHFDIVEWLAPDWVLNMADGKLARGRLRRPPIELEIYRCARSTWQLFAKHHYLNANMPAASQTFLALWNGEPTALVAVSSCFGHKGMRQISRIVVLPDYQGVGIGAAATDAVAAFYKQQGFRVVITTGHPAMIGVLKRAANWRVKHVKRRGACPNKGNVLGSDGQRRKHVKSSQGRSLISAEFVGGC